MRMYLAMTGMALGLIAVWMALAPFLT